MDGSNPSESTIKYISEHILIVQFIFASLEYILEMGLKSYVESRFFETFYNLNAILTIIRM